MKQRSVSYASRVLLAAIVTLILPVSMLGAQTQAVITGKVTDASGNGVPGANVVIPSLGLGVGANTRVDGTYTITFDIQGFKTVKIKLGVSPEYDIACPQEVRKAIGYSYRLRTDANQAWNPMTAITQVQKLEGLDIPEVSLVAILDADKEGYLDYFKKTLPSCGPAGSSWPIT